ncbi:MAG: B12-binding domain-containing radical SAM protein [Thermodesulfobacteriota bacterium]
MSKIVFIEANPPDFHIFTKMPLPRLGTVLLSTILKNNGYEVKSFVESVAEMNLEEVLKADIIGLSTITSTSMRSYEMARLFKKAGKTVFMGGPHVTYMPDEGLEVCDFVMRGEADDHILNLVRALESGKGYEDIPGLSYRKDGKVYHNRNVSLCKDINTLPCPDFKLIHGMEELGLKKFSITPVMTSRGCPYDCSFCSVTGMFGQKYRFRDKERVIEELENIRRENKNWVFFYDDNFCAHKKRTKELLHTMIEKKLTPNWTAQVRVEIAKDPELLDLMKKSNCHTVYIGLESVNPATLKAYNKKQTVEDITACIKALHKKGIRIHGMFVFGSDLDTTDTIAETVKFAKKNDLDSVQFLILTPLPGTQCYRDLDREGRIITKDWSLYDAHHVVFEPKLMSYYELQHETVMATKEFYSIGQIAKRALKLDLFNVGIKTYGHNLTKKWIKKNANFVEYTQKLTSAGRTIELAAKKTAEDVKEKFHKLELSGSIVHPKSH